MIGRLGGIDQDWVLGDGMRHRPNSSRATFTLARSARRAGNNGSAEVDGKVTPAILSSIASRAHAKELMKSQVGSAGGPCLRAFRADQDRSLTNVEAVLTTQGSPIYNDRHPCPLRPPVASTSKSMAV